MKQQNVELGDKVVCEVTGFIGIVTSIAKCLNGCDRIVIQPRVDKDGKHPESLWFDITQVKILKKQVVKSYQEQSVSKKGGWPTKGMP